MNLKDIVNNQALEISPIAFELPEVICFADESGEVRYRPHKRAIVYKENGDVEFNLQYWPKPDIESAEIEVMWGEDRKTLKKFPMKNEGCNWWSVVISGIPTGNHFFQLYVNGFPVLHPAAPICFNQQKYSNFIEVPDLDDTSFLIKDVSHGTIHTEYFHSSISQSMKDCLIYTPPGYETGNKKYPVLYLLAGGGENETNWFYCAKANFMFDNLIAEGKMEEMIVVCMDGYVFSPEDDYMKHTHIPNFPPVMK